MSLAIRALGPENVDDLLAFFDHDAFSDNPYWSGCYCGFYETPGDDWDPASGAAAEHRAAKRSLVLARRASGYVAYADGRVVGWLNAQPRDAYENLRGFAAAPIEPGTGLLMCFVVAPHARERGIATALLRAACDGFRERGLRYAQGFARIGRRREEWERFSTMNYHGPRTLYDTEGFVEIGEVGDYAVVRKTL